MTTARQDLRDLLLAGQDLPLVRFLRPGLVQGMTGPAQTARMRVL
jgi:hypothetical protein